MNLRALAFAVLLVSVGCKRERGAGPAGIDAMAVVPAPPLDCGDAGGDWPMSGQNVCNTRSQAPSSITTKSAATLAMKWKFNAMGDISATPAVVAGQVYVPDWSGMLYRIDGTTGQAVWSTSIANIVAQAGDGGADADTESQGGGPIMGGSPFILATPGLVARGTPAVYGNLVIFGIASTQAAYLVAVDKDTGTFVWQTLLDPHPAAVITSSPVVDDNGRIYVGVSSNEEGFPLGIPGYKCCSFRGSVAALDGTTGKLIWQTPTIDDSVYFNGDGSLSGFAGGAVWSSPTVDHKRNLLYATSGNNYSAPASQVDGGALPTGDRIESILALDLDMGTIRWSQRMTSGDIWNVGNLYAHDYDFGCAANLFQAPVGGVTIDVVGAGQKSGMYWAVDPDTGTPLWKTQVGPGGHLGGIQWGTAVDGTRVYVGVNDETGSKYKLGGSGSEAGTTVTTGSWAALDPGTGETLWQIPDPALSAPLNQVSVNGPIVVVNGVLFAGSMDSNGTMFAFDASSGATLWSFQSGATVYGGPAVVGGVVYWGNGYPSGRLGFGTPGHTLFAFAVSGG
jgi:polyvinyl alcohol dehydrogenase (cytochrome)